MLELAGHFQQETGLLALLQPRHLSKRAEIVLHGISLGLTLAPLGITQHELAVLGIATGLVAFQAGLRTNLGPDLIGKKHIHHGGASGSTVGLQLRAPRAGREQRQRREHGPSGTS